MTTAKIVKSFCEKTLFEIENEGGVRTRVGWDRLKDYLSEAVGLNGKEKIEGITVEDDGIHVRIGYKK